MLGAARLVRHHRPRGLGSRSLRSLQSFVGVPLWLDGVLVGVLEFGSDVPACFGRADIALLSTLGTHVAALLRSATVRDTLVEILGLTDLNELLSTIVDRIPNLVGGKGCSLFLRRRPGEGDAYLVASRGLDQGQVARHFFAAAPGLDHAAHYQPEIGLTGWVLATGEVLNLELHKDSHDRSKAVAELSRQAVERGLPPITWRSLYREDTSCPGSPQATADDFARKAWLGVPLLLGGRVYGVLRISERASGNFTVEECELVRGCAQRTSDALGKAIAENEAHGVMLDVVSALAAAIDKKDPYTEGHSQNVRNLAVKIGKRLGMDDRRLHELEMAALLHDVGKIGIPDLILSKPGKFNAAERRCMDIHPILGYKILERIRGTETIREGILGHHERLDGTGSPRQLKGESISIFARIIAVADSFDAACAVRPYKASKQPDEAFTDIQGGAGSQYDPKVVEAFTALYFAELRRNK